MKLGDSLARPLPDRTPNIDLNAWLKRGQKKRYEVFGSSLEMSLVARFEVDYG